PIRPSALAHGLVGHISLLHHDPLFHGVKCIASTVQYLPGLGAGVHKVPGADHQGSDGGRGRGGGNSCVGGLGFRPAGGQGGGGDHAGGGHARIFKEFASFHG